jgi:hypothetical protein
MICPNCHIEFGDHMGVEQRYRRNDPKPGDMLLCIVCGEFSVLRADGQLDAATAEQVNMIPPEMRREARAGVVVLRTLLRAFG